MQRAASENYNRAPDGCVWRNYVCLVVAPPGIFDFSKPLPPGYKLRTVRFRLVFHQPQSAPLDPFQQVVIQRPRSGGTRRDEAR